MKLTFGRGVEGRAAPSPTRGVFTALSNKDMSWNTTARGKDPVGFLKSLLQGLFCQGPCVQTQTAGADGSPPGAMPCSERAGPGRHCFLCLPCPLLLLSSSFLAAAFKNDKCVLILEHRGNNCFYFSGEEE